MSYIYIYIYIYIHIYMGLTHVARHRAHGGEEDGLLQLGVRRLLEGGRAQVGIWASRRDSGPRSSREHDRPGNPIGSAWRAGSASARDEARSGGVRHTSVACLADRQIATALILQGALVHCKRAASSRTCCPVRCRADS